MKYNRRGYFIIILYLILVIFSIRCEQKSEIKSESSKIESEKVYRTPVGFQSKMFSICSKYVSDSLNSGIVYAVVKPEYFRTEIVGVSPKSPGGNSALGLIENNIADLVIGSGFVSRFIPPAPLGLLIVNHTTINPVQDDGYSSIVYVKNQSLHIVPKELFNSKDVNSAFQVGPMLIYEDKIKIKKSEITLKPAHTRSFVGIQKNRNILAGITERPVKLYHLANYLSDSLKCSSAVNLSGGGSEALAIRIQGKVRSFGNPEVRQGSLLIFKKKEMYSSSQK